MSKYVSQAGMLAGVMISLTMLTACQPTPVKPMETGFQPTTVNYEYKVGNSTVSDNVIFSEIEAALVSQVAVVQPKRRLGATNGIAPVTGYEIEKSCTSTSSCTIYAKYYKGNYNTGTGNEYLNIQTLAFPVNITRSEGIARVSIELTGAINAEKTGGGFAFMSGNPLLNAAQVKTIFDRVASMRPVISVMEKYNGEFQLPEVSDVIVYANFQRMMGIYERTSEASKNDIGMSSWFRLNTGNQTVPLGVTVYPTRSGALVKYFFEMKYSLSPNGESPFDPNLIASLKQNIEKVAAM